MAQLKSVSQDETLTAYHKVLAWFFSYPTEEFTLNELSSAIKTAKTTARSIVLQLMKEKFLTLEKLGILWRIKANQEHHYFITKKIPYNLNLVYESEIAAVIIEMEITELGIIKQLGYRKNVKVNMHTFSRSKADLNVFTNIANGIVLYGLLEAKP